MGQKCELELHTWVRRGKGKVKGGCQRVSNCWDWKKGIGNRMHIQHKWILRKNLVHIKLQGKLGLEAKVVSWIKCRHGGLAFSHFGFSGGLLSSGAQLTVEWECVTCPWRAGSAISLGVCEPNAPRSQTLTCMVGGQYSETKVNRAPLWAFGSLYHQGIKSEGCETNWGKSNLAGERNHGNIEITCFQKWFRTQFFFVFITVCILLFFIGKRANCLHT